MAVVLREGLDEYHGGELLVQSLEVEILRSERLAELHRLVHLVDEGLEGLDIVLPDGKEVIVCIEATTSLLLTIHCV